MPEKKERSRSFKIQGIFLLLAFVVALSILLTDKNLQTDFGIQHPYFIHWYGMLVIAIVSLIGGAILLVSTGKMMGMAGTIGSSLLALFLVADVATFSQVGFKYASQFATYLFGISKYPGTLSYVPGLYDLLLVLFILAAVSGAISLRR
jgi:hypothetical protein